MDPDTRFRALFATAYPALRRYALHRGVTGGDADDLVSEVLTIAWRRIDAVPADDPMPWLFAVARNVRRNDRRRSDGLRRLRDRLSREGDVSAPAYEPTGVDATVVRAALAALEEDDRELLLLVGWDDLTPTQAASVLGCTPGTLRVRLHRARARLLNEMAKRETRLSPTTVRRAPRPEEVHDGR